MRNVSDAEGVVVRAILAGAELRTATRELPRRTRGTVRRRSYERNWLVDRYVPDFAALGRPILTFAIAQPYLESVWATVHRWRDRPENLLLWASAEAVFGVFASKPGAPLRVLAREIVAPPRHRSDLVVTVDTRQPTVPVFFDFEAAWARAVGIEGDLAYPQPIPTSPRGPSGAALSPAELEAAVGLLGGTTGPKVVETSGGVGARAHLGRFERRILRDGIVQPRTFLNPAAVVRWVGGFPPQVTFLHGALRSGRRPEGLFHTALGDCGLRPFLFVTDDRSVFMAHLSGGGGRSGRDHRTTTPVLPALQDWLSEIVVVRQPLDGLEVLTDHRYDRPFTHGAGTTPALSIPSPSSHSPSAQAAGQEGTAVAPPPIRRAAPMGSA